VEKGCRRVNMVQILFINGKMRPIETKGGRMRENGGEDEFKYDIFHLL
jgi:hypothetical protein